MAELCLMASSIYPPGLFHQEQGLCRVSKEFQPFIPSPGTRHVCVHTRPIQPEDPWKPASWFSESNQSEKLDLSIRRPVLVDVQDSRPHSVLFSFGIAEQCTRHEKILQFLSSGSSEAETDGLDLALLSDLMGLQMAIDLQSLPHRVGSSDGDFCLYEVGSDSVQPFLVHPSKEFQKPLLDFMGDLTHSSKITVNPDGKVLLTGSGTEMKDLLSIVAEFYMSKNLTEQRKLPLLVPHFTRLERSETKTSIHGSPLKLETVTVAPLKSPEKIKMKPSPRKKQSKKAGNKSDLYRRNHFHACEILLSLVLNRRQGKMAILSLKKSGSELAELLTQLSAGIAGTGLAVIFSVVCKVVGGRVPFCASKILNTGFGFALVWLSWAVNRLRDTVVYISKNSHKLGLKEEGIMKRVDRNMNEILFRAATLMTVALLRLA
ncbi:PREDICTED: uncharacterized protein LOC104612891 [Nelumbo nucifera]|uniref:Uncharacterized protein LOC104612891 n=2 Tax=Nelumbo nucifera TaxID=4432 RepID=A0A1U8BFI1_NELNU|nr:PREDICTED: uncharacterized protein LOC104612891 [Nelumbo nucifera]XP_010278839.1 PREDICTED: uncharacterized protein LOC104612891 [Nelumbo nucifera]DAD33552.1 TPA_asm: hypothetical protein HUJ06_012403 [Nelumbo nucifera]